jgi:hypothetical protein
MIQEVNALTARYLGAEKVAPLAFQQLPYKSAASQQLESHRAISAAVSKSHQQGSQGFIQIWQKWSVAYLLSHLS